MRADGGRVMTAPRRDRKPAGASVERPRVSLELRSLLPYPNSCLGASPHQQGRDTKMLSFCGIDVSKVDSTSWYCPRRSAVARASTAAFRRSA